MQTLAQNPLTAPLSAGSTVPSLHADVAEPTIVAAVAQATPGDGQSSGTRQSKTTAALMNKSANSDELRFEEADTLVERSFALSETPKAATPKRTSGDVRSSRLSRRKVVHSPNSPHNDSQKVSSREDVTAPTENLTEATEGSATPAPA